MRRENWFYRMFLIFMIGLLCVAAIADVARGVQEARAKNQQRFEQRLDLFGKCLDAGGEVRVCLRILDR